MKQLLKTLLLVCVLTASSSLEAAPAEACGEADLACVQRLLLDKQDEVLSLGRRIGLREQEVELLKDTTQMVREQLNIALSSNKTLLEAASKLAPRWYESPWLWFSVGVVVGAGLVVFSVWGAGQLLR